jgi:hypothetical protein
VSAAAPATISDEVVSILINNAGVPGPVVALVDVEPEEWTRCSRSTRGTYLIYRRSCRR